MKKALTLLTVILSLNFGLNAQTVQKTKEGNYIAVKAAETTEKAKDTGKTFTDTKGNVYPVFISAKGKLFVIRISKNTGKEYKQYLKVD